MAALDASELVRLVREVGGDVAVTDNGRMEIRDPARRVGRELRDAIKAHREAVFAAVVGDVQPEDARAAYVREAFKTVDQQVSCHPLADPGAVVARLWETMAVGLDEAERTARALGLLYQEGQGTETAEFDQAITHLGRRWTEALDALDSACHWCGERKIVVLVDRDGDRMCHRCMTTPPPAGFRGRGF